MTQDVSFISSAIGDAVGIKGTFQAPRTGTRFSGKHYSKLAQGTLHLWLQAFRLFCWCCWGSGSTVRQHFGGIGREAFEQGWMASPVFDFLCAPSYTPGTQCQWPGRKGRYTPWAAVYVPERRRARRTASVPFEVASQSAIQETVFFTESVGKLLSGGSVILR